MYNALKKFKFVPKITAITSFRVIEALSNLAIPICVAFILSSITNTIVDAEKLNIKVIGLLFFTLCIVGLFLYPRIKNVASILTYESSCQLKQTLFDKIAKVSLNKNDFMQSGYVLSIINVHMRQTEDFLSNVFGSVIVNSIMVVVLLALIFAINLQYGLICLLFGILFPVLCFPSQQKLKKFAKDVQRDKNKEGEYFTNIVNNRNLFAYYPVSQKYFDYFINMAVSIKNMKIKIGKISGYYNALTWLLNGMRLFLLLALGILVFNIPIGTILGVYMLSSYLSGSIATLTDSIIPFKMSVESVNILEDFLILDEEPSIEVLEAETSCNMSLEMKDVYYSYKDHMVLKGFNLKIEPGQRVAIIGDIGSGKSTILKLFLGFILPQKGEIFVQGIKQDKSNYVSLRKYISYVDQNSLIFDGTIKENIISFADDIDESKLEQILHVAQLNDLIAQLPLGIDTPIKEMERNFSGGQTQRIAIARALYDDTSILFLDEPTSAMDGELEKSFINMISNIKNKTIVIVTHRAYSYSWVDKVIKIEKVIE